MAGKALTSFLAIVFIVTSAWAFGGGGGGGGAGVGSTVDLLMPGPPVDVKATPGSSMATVAFKPPKSDGGSTITAYTVTSHPEGIRARGAKSPLTVRGLTNGRTYTFTATASNSVGTGLDSQPSNDVTPGGQ